MEFALHVDRSDSRALHKQVADQIREGILDQRLTAGARLPSTRSLAVQLEVSRNVVLAAFDELFAEGYIEGRHGSGTYVSTEIPNIAPPTDQGRLANRPATTPQLTPLPPAGRQHPLSSSAARIDFRMGQPSLDPLQQRLWRRLWRDMASQQPPTNYGPPQGYFDLRAAIAEYLGRSRGITCTPEMVLITSGSLQALDLVARATIERGDAVAIEDPGYPRAVSNLRLNGARIVPIPVDQDGIDVDHLAQVREVPRLVYVTPSHQYPTGARMPVARRLALISWAAERGTLIVEDDYDSELRFDGAPLPALAGLDQSGSTVYIGTFSKMITPTLRVGYVVGPVDLIDHLARIKMLTDFQTSWPLQEVITGFISSGRLDRHIRAMRRHYAEKRHLLGDILSALGDLGRLQGLEAGLHAYLELQPDIDENEVVGALAMRGVRVEAAGSYAIVNGAVNGLLLGYGGLSTEQIQEGTRAIVDVVLEISDQSRSRLSKTE